MLEATSLNSLVNGELKNKGAGILRSTLFTAFSKKPKSVDS